MGMLFLYCVVYYLFFVFKCNNGLVCKSYVKLFMFKINMLINVNILIMVFLVLYVVFVYFFN